MVITLKSNIGTGNLCFRLIFSNFIIFFTLFCVIFVLNSIENNFYLKNYIFVQVALFVVLETLVRFAVFFSLAEFSKDCCQVRVCLPQICVLPEFYRILLDYFEVHFHFWTRKWFKKSKFWKKFNRAGSWEFI